MSREEVLEYLNELCRELFFDDDLVVTEDTVASDVEGWDSLGHLELISEIENHYNIKFTMGEIQGFANVGELVDVILKRIQKK